MATEFYFTPELHLKDGRIIRDLNDAASFAREQEVRPGVDQRDEVLHKTERAASKEDAMLQHTPLCDGWKSWTFSNSAGSRTPKPSVVSSFFQKSSETVRVPNFRREPVATRTSKPEQRREAT